MMNKHLSVIALLSAAMFVVPVLAQDLSVGVSTTVSAEVSAQVSVPTSQVSSALSSVSSELTSSSMSSSGDMSSMPSIEPKNCGTGEGDIDTVGMMMGAIDAAALASVATVTVIAVGDCSGLAEIDGATAAAIETNIVVQGALSASGMPGGEVVAYAIDGSALTVYVRKR